jgi:hypothetical protein
VYTALQAELIYSWFFGFATGVLLSSGMIDVWVLLRRFHKSPYRNDTVVLTFDSEGFHGKGEKSEVNAQWSIFTKACRFPDGILLFQGPSFYHWLPESTLVDGNINDFENMVFMHVKEYKVYH